MSFQADHLPEWLPESLRNDPKKAGILGVLVLLLLVAIVRFAFFGGPAAATAGVKNQDPNSTRKTVGPKTRGSVIVGASGEARAWIKEPITSVSRNLFTIRQEYYPSLASKVDLQKQQVVTGFWDEIEKSRSQQVDQKRRREILVENLQREAAKLQLQSTVMGPEPQAIIGGNLVREGSVVASDGPATGVPFRVLKIEARRVIVEREGIRLEIRMQQ